MCKGSPGAARNGGSPAQATVGNGDPFHSAPKKFSSGNISRLPGSKQGGWSAGVGVGRRRYNLRSGDALASEPCAPSQADGFLATNELEDTARVVPKVSIEGCRKRVNPYHVCSEFCRAFVQENPTQPRSPVLSVPSPLHKKDNSPHDGADCFFLGDSLVSFAEKPADFSILDDSIIVVLEDLGARSVVLRCLHKRPSRSSFLEWIKDT